MGLVKFKPGFVEGKDQKQIVTLEEALKQDADCGCGIDCCKNRLVLKDQTNGNTYELVFDGGVLKFRIAGSIDSYTAV